VRSDQGRRIRQRLLALPDVERTQTCEFCGTLSLPVADFQATLRVTPVIDGGRVFVEWWATFDCEPARRAEISAILSGWFAKWCESLRARLEGRSAALATEAPDSDAEQAKFGLIYRLWLRD